jgi:hypothetical protein
MRQLNREGKELKSLENWQSWLDEAIGEARQRGDFDNLAGEGKPLPARSSQHAGDWSLAFDMLESAGYAPYWIELGKEIRAETNALDKLRERTARHLAEHRARSQAAPALAKQESRPSGRRWWPFRSEWAASWRDETRSGPDLVQLEATRRRNRAEYLERAAKLDERIAEYNAAIPRDLWRLQRPRRSVDEAARAFDAACPPVLHR